MLPDADDIPDVPVCDDILPEEFDMPDVPDIDDVPLAPVMDDIPLVPDMDDIPLVPVCELDIVDPVVCERGVVVVPPWVGIVVVVWPATVQVAPIIRAKPKITCLIITCSF